VSDQAPKERDQLDRLIARHVRAARRPDGVPVPGSAEPGDEELLRVIEGSASAEERVQVAEAAARSAWTRDRLEILKESLAETGHTSAVERAARYVFAVARDAMQLLRGATEPVAAPAAAHTLRKGGSADTSSAGDAYFEFDHDFDDVHAVLRVEHVPRDTGSIDLQIRVDTAQTRVTLLRGAHTVDSTPVDDRGIATFTGLDAVRYRLEVRRSGRLAGSVILDFIGTDPDAS
jgi:hypothetical protein